MHQFPNKVDSRLVFRGLRKYVCNMTEFVIAVYQEYFKTEFKTEANISVSHHNDLDIEFTDFRHRQLQINKAINL